MYLKLVPCPLSSAINLTFSKQGGWLSKKFVAPVKNAEMNIGFKNVCITHMLTHHGFV